MNTGLLPRVEPLRHGPTGSPARTLAWSALEWTADYLLQPDGPDAGEPWRYTPEQVRLMLWWYAVDEVGRFVYRRGILRRMKGWGKDPFAAALAAVELCGPCRYGGNDAKGEPVAIPHPAPWIQTAAVSRDQTRNTMTLFPGMFSPAAHDEYGLDMGKEIIYTRRGGRIESVTSSPRALEGGRPSLVIMNETHHWLANNDGHGMAKAIARNLAKSRDGAARSLAITNAHEPGEDSVGEWDWEAYQAIVQGRSVGTGILYDSAEAPPETVLSDPVSLRAGLVAARGDSDWLDVDRLIEEIYDPSTSADMTRRYYLNQITAAETAYFDPRDWALCTDAAKVVADGDTIAMFFDGSKTDDSSGLVGCRIDDGHLFTIGAWEKPSGPAGKDWEVNRAEVDLSVSRAFDRYDVVVFYADVKEFEQYVDTWGERYADRLLIDAAGGKSAHPVAWDMRSHKFEFTKAAERLGVDVADHALTHDGNPIMAAHIANARRSPNQWGVSMSKEHRESPRKIDLAVCAAGARQARRDLIASGRLAKRQAKGPAPAYGF